MSIFNSVCGDQFENVDGGSKSTNRKELGSFITCSVHFGAS